MNALIPLIQREGKPAVSARELYRFLELKAAHFARWAKMNIVENPVAIEGEDWIATRHDGETPTGGKIDREDFALSIPFAKELAMMARSAKGKAAREYFLRCEQIAQAKPARRRKTLPHQDAAWLQTREETKGKRKLLTGVLASHGVRDRDGYSVCTNAAYVALFGRTAAEIKARGKLKKSASLREYLSTTALLAVGLTEALAIDRIEGDQLTGAYRCQEAIRTIGTGIAKAAGGKLRATPHPQLTA